MTAPAQSAEDATEASRVAVWKRITAAIVAGAPVPHMQSISGRAEFVTLGYLIGDTQTDAAAMVRALGLDRAYRRDLGGMTRWQYGEGPTYWSVDAYETPASPAGSTTTTSPEGATQHG